MCFVNVTCRLTILNNEYVFFIESQITKLGILCFTLIQKLVSLNIGLQYLKGTH